MSHVHALATPQDQANQLLAARDLRITKPRHEVLTLLLQADKALSTHEIEQRLPAGADRVTVYRTIKTFVQAGLLHAVPDEAYGQRYAVCDLGHCHTEGTHAHDHLHFKCNSCGDTLCLEDVSLPPLPIPPGYTVDEITVVAKGICHACQAGN